MENKIKFFGEIMNIIELQEIQKGEQGKLLNLLEKYIFEASAYDKSDLNEDGLYTYPAIEYYWKEYGRYAYWITMDGVIAGFAMVSKHKDGKAESDWTMAEFCILPKYRHDGIGKTAAQKIFAKHKGVWEVQYHPDNHAGKSFWHKVVNEFTAGKYKTEISGANEPYNNGVYGDILYFESL